MADAPAEKVKRKWWERGIIIRFLLRRLLPYANAPWEVGLVIGITQALGVITAAFLVLVLSYFILFILKDKLGGINSMYFIKNLFLSYGLGALTFVIALLLLMPIAGALIGWINGKKKEKKA